MSETRDNLILKMAKMLSFHMGADVSEYEYEHEIEAEFDMAFKEFEREVKK